MGKTADSTVKEIEEWPDRTVAARYGFLHALYQETIYEQVPVNRRLRWHRQIGMRLEAAYGPRAREVAAELAAHFRRGGDIWRTVQYLERQRSQRRAPANCFAGSTRRRRTRDRSLTCPEGVTSP